MKKNFTLYALLTFTLVLSGCNGGSPAKPQSSAPQKSELETGRFALQKLIPAARMWAPDAQVIRLQSEVMKDNDGHDGKSGFWRATFGSVAGQKAKAFTWSGMTGPGAPPHGIDHGSEQAFNPANRSMQTFDLNFLRVDTDKAFQVGQEHGGKQLLEKDPKQPVIYLLSWNAEENQLHWNVIYGSNAFGGKLTVVVNATTGEYIRKE